MSVLSHMAFGPLTIAFDDRVLRPRPWTEAQSRWAARLLVDAPPGPVLDLCTGAGHLGLAAVAGTDRRIVLVDLEPAACDLARRNADAAGLGDRVDVRHGSMTEVLDPDERFAVIVADPPWVSSARVPNFPEDPVLAIDGGADGLALVRECLRVIERHLADGGSAVLQAGPDQAERIRDELGPASRVGLAGVERYERGVLLLLTRTDG